MPKIAEIEPTPNPNAMKFILREPLTWGITRSYDKPEQAVGDPLAMKLFDIEHVTNVFYVDHWVTVTQDGSADWQELMRDLAVPIREAPSADANSDKLAEQSSEAMDPAKLSPENRERLDKINAILDEQIRPYLQNDGGDLYVMGLEGNKLTVHYQGACGSCPSSLSGTLAGIENLVCARSNPTWKWSRSKVWRTGSKWLRSAKSRPGTCKVADVDGTAVAVFNVGGDYFAIEDVCTHDGGELASGVIEGDQVVCPRHGARFCVRTGDALSAPAYEPTAKFPLRIENGVIEVRDDRWD